MILPPLIDGLYEPFHEIEPILLQDYLGKWQTEWFRIQSIDTTDEEEQKLTLYNRGRQTILQYFRIGRIYGFAIFLPQPDDIIHYYDLYKQLGRDEEKKEEDLSFSFNPSLPEEYSATYIYEAVRQLSLYREQINKGSLLHMNSILFRRRDRPHSYDYMLPQLLYKTLRLRTLYSEVVIKKPGSSSSNHKDRLLIEPVYGPSHSPLKITLKDGQSLRIHMNKQSIREPDTTGIDEISLNIFLNVSNEQNVVYDVVAVVAGLSRLPSLEYSNVIGYLKEYKTSKDLIGQLRSMRLSVLEMDILYAVKLSQVFEPDASKERQVEIGKEWHSRIYDEYSNLYGSANQKEIKGDTEMTLKNIILDLKKVI